MTERETRADEIEKTIQRFSIFLERLKKKSKNFSWYRLFILLSGLIIFLFLFFAVSQTSAFISAVFFISLFGIVTGSHNRVDFTIRKFIIGIRIKETNLARIKIDWDNVPFRSEMEIDKLHPFEPDLNINGKHSLLHLIDTSVSKEGTKLLRDWLTARKPNYNVIIKRQKIIKELIPLVRFREKLQLTSFLVSKNKLHGDSLISHLKESSNINALKKILFTLSILIPLNIIFFLLFLLFNIPAYFSIGLLIQLGIYWFNLKHVNELFEKAVMLEDELGKFSRILKFIESYPYAKNNNLKEFCSAFLMNDFKPSKKFKQINRTVLALSLQKNPLTLLLSNIIFPWDFFHAYRLEKLKREIAEQLPIWLDTWYNLEALISLANLAYLNPEYSFPELVENKEKYFFSADEIRHPLIPFEYNVQNNFSILSGETVIVTGSNMSGKSTFLKTLGLNLSLAYAGAPVRAKKLQTSLFRLYTCINISDSVTDGISYFYAEVKRLKALLNELKKENELPLFYLIDEIFRGTNNLERLIGSRSYIKELASLKGMGLISTHDLELIKLESEIPDILNYHFREEVIKDKMIFDYKFRQGPCPTTNALKIMQLEGLPVEN